MLRALSELPRSPPKAETPPTDMAHILSVQRRCWVIDCLDLRAPASIHELADAIAEIEFGPEYDAQQRKAIYIGLYQGHLEAMDEAGVIEADDDFRSVDRGPAFAAYRKSLEALRTYSEHGSETDLRADGGEAPPMYCPGCETTVPEHYDTYDEAFRCPECGSHTYEDKETYIETKHATARWNKEHGWGPFNERHDGDDKDAKADGGQERPRLEHDDADIATGDVVVDLASGQALQVVGKSTQTVGEHRATRSDGTAELFGADADEPVYMCVYLPDGDRLSPPSKTYAYPESRLLRYPVEDATDYAGSIQTWIRTAVLDELADGLAARGDEQLASDVAGLVGDVYDDEVADIFEEMLRSQETVEADR